MEKQELMTWFLEEFNGRMPLVVTLITDGQQYKIFTIHNKDGRFTQPIQWQVLKKNYLSKKDYKIGEYYDNDEHMIYIKEIVSYT